MPEAWNLNWPRALGGAAISADFRTEPEDFVVDELAFPETCDGGEHVYLHIKKRGANTAWVAKQLAKLAGVRPLDVSYFGLKDRHAVTTQWFSVWLGQKSEPDWSQINSDEILLLQNFRGARKLRRGEHVGNRFKIRLRSTRGDRQAAQQVLEQIGDGVPNYFGEQRFGIKGGNLDLVRQLAEEEGRCRKSDKAFAMSAARSWLFNQVLADRVGSGNWLECLEGEPEVDPSGPLWGRGRNPAAGIQGELEEAILQAWQPWCNWLEHCGLKQERRQLILRPEAFCFQWEGDDLTLEFALPPGAFATALLREVAELVNVNSDT
ncbi:tRNA pseudouridine(13) synthase TruD [Microbulbifer sp. GL-2]|uniref:tRNA pseudouridine(13) synthase TruD n=1 Tax=Microbulbifer sp. GL-2 TaxID=2591606 RepID=UPI0011622F1B|nr:tRNA pseudouridine(13) synthase TruD [Microbulbifer sp. GL-2]BBM02638.1 tRNA pseudouridine synthase D [Microbulbifer sp. GL-2]